MADEKKVGVGSNFKLGTSGESPSETAARVAAVKRKKRTAPRVGATAHSTLGHMSPYHYGKGAEGGSDEFKAGYAAGIEASQAAVEAYSQDVKALVTDLVTKHAAELAALSPVEEVKRFTLDEKAIEAIVAERVALVSPERKSATKSIDGVAFQSFEELEAAMNGEQISRPQFVPRKWHRY